MILMQAVQDDTMAVPGFERHTFMCSDCHDVEQRLVFIKPVDQGGETEPVTVHIAPPISPLAVEPASPVENERTAHPGILTRMFAKLRGGRRAASSSVRPD
jgi:hypothetical protein